MNTTDRIRATRAGLAGLMMVATSMGGCVVDELAPTFVLRVAMAPDEPPENGELGLLVHVQAGIFEGEGEGAGMLVLGGVGAELRVSDRLSRDTEQCVLIPVRGAGVDDAVVLPVLVHPEGRSARLFVSLWGVPSRPMGDGVDGCPEDLSDRARLASAALLVPPDESEPDASGQSTGADTSAGPETSTGAGLETSTNASDSSTTDGSSTGAENTTTTGGT